MDYDFENLEDLEDFNDEELFNLMDQIDFNEGQKEVEQIEKSCLGCGLQHTLFKDTMSTFFSIRHCTPTM